MWWLVAYCTAVSILGFPSAAHAYIDPGSGSLLLQSFAFLFLLAGVFFRNMERCLHRLAERDRRVLVLTFYAQKASSEIAEELGVTGTVVRVARHRALERLRECVGLQGAKRL